MFELTVTVKYYLANADARAEVAANGNAIFRSRRMSSFLAPVLNGMSVGDDARHTCLADSV